MTIYFTGPPINQLNVPWKTADATDWYLIDF